MNRPMKNRREFLATVGAAGAASIVAGSAGRPQVSPPKAARRFP